MIDTSPREQRPAGSGESVDPDRRGSSSLTRPNLLLTLTFVIGCPLGQRRVSGAELCAHLLGSGAALAPRFLVLVGTDRQRFPRATDVQRLTGIAPVNARSGQRCTVQWRWSAPTFMG